MGKDREPLDSLTGRIASGIHIVAMAVMCSANASSTEIALAGEILKRDPPRAMPRELAGAIETFNRQMDAAIDSANASAGCGTRAERRAQLASALERAGLVIIEQATLAELLSRTLAGGTDPFEDEEPFDDGDELGVPLLSAEEETELVDWINGNVNLQPLDAIFADAVSGLGVGLVDGHGGVTHVPIGDFLETDERAVAGDDHRVND